MIGEIFDHVYSEAATKVNENVQTTVIPAGGAAIVEFTVQVPGTFILVDHSLFRAFNKGTLAMLKVEGPENKEIYSGREIDSVYLGDKALPSAALGTAAEKAARGTLTKADEIAAGKQLFLGTCSPCHQQEAKGGQLGRCGGDRGSCHRTQVNAASTRGRELRRPCGRLRCSSLSSPSCPRGPFGPTRAPYRPRTAWSASARVPIGHSIRRRTRTLLVAGGDGHRDGGG